MFMLNFQSQPRFKRHPVEYVNMKETYFITFLSYLHFFFSLTIEDMTVTPPPHKKTRHSKATESYIAFLLSF